MKRLFPLAIAFLVTPVLAQQTQTPNPNLRNRIATMGVPWTPMVDIKGMPCSCKNSGADNCRFKVFVGSEDETLRARIVQDQSGTTTLVSIGSFVLKEAGNGQLYTDFECPNGVPPDPLDPYQVLEYKHRFVFLIIVQSATSHAPTGRRDLAYCPPPTGCWGGSPRECEAENTRQTHEYAECQRRNGYGRGVRQ
jgi:hypothetical protein